MPDDISRRDALKHLVDLATMPLYVRAGAVLPMGSVKQYADEPSDEPTTLIVYPGVDGMSMLYEDDGISFAHRTGDWMRIELRWQDRARRLTLRLTPDSRMLPPTQRQFNVRVAGSRGTTPVVFAGRAIQVTL